MILRARQFEFRFPGPTLAMGIVNVTPDSFSDGGQFLDPDRAIEHGLALVRAGADILDVGGESTRPGAQPVAEAEERRRVLPVIERLAALTRVPISVDTRKPMVARDAVAAGAAIINDVGANRTDPTMWRVAAETGAGYVCMHMRGDPLDMQVSPVYEDVVSEVRAFLEERCRQLSGCGVRREQIILDPGIGFGKTVEHNLRLLAALGELADLDRPLLLGVSRKSFIGKVTGADLDARLPGALACTALAVDAGVKIVRTHDVSATVQALWITEAILQNRRFDVGSTETSRGH